MKYLLIIVVVYLFVLILKKYKNKESFGNLTPNSLYNFDHKIASYEYPKIVSIFGYPHVFEDMPNGFIMWNRPGIFEKIYLMDEAIKHNDHCDFLYATIKIHIPEFAREKVNSLSDSFMYDRLKQELTVRCNSLSNIVKIMIATLEIIHKKSVFGDKFKWLSSTLDENHTLYADKLNIKECVNSLGTQPSLLR